MCLSHTIPIMSEINALKNEIGICKFCLILFKNHANMIVCKPNEPRILNSLTSYIHTVYCGRCIWMWIEFNRLRFTRTQRKQGAYTYIWNFFLNIGLDPYILNLKFTLKLKPILATNPKYDNEHMNSILRLK